MSDDHDHEPIKARFYATRRRMALYGAYHELRFSIDWRRGQSAEDDEATTKHLNTLIANLPSLINDGLQEVTVQAEVAGLDQEWLELDEPVTEEDDSE